MKPTRTIWAVESYRAGETSQILGLAEGLNRALGWNVISKCLDYNRLAGSAALCWSVSLSGISFQSRQILTPPWPDLLIVAGARNEPIARWIKRQSGGLTRVAFLGRTWAPTSRFDLLVTTPQYRVVAADNVLENSTTLHRIHPDRLAQARADWQTSFAKRPSPRTVVLIGGDSGPYALRANTVQKLAATLHERAAQDAGSILVTTSSRTHHDAVHALGRAMPDAWCYCWRANDPDNPYFGLLAWADHIVVTSDSIAMISEALAVGVPVSLFDLAEHADATLKTRAYQWLMRLGPRRLTRDIGVAHERLIQTGAITRLGNAWDAQSSSDNSALARTITRIEALFQDE